MYCMTHMYVHIKYTVCKMQTIKSSNARMHMVLKYILIVIRYTFSGFDISNENVDATAAKIKQIFAITPHMYQ